MTDNIIDPKEVKKVKVEIQKLFSGKHQPKCDISDEPKEEEEKDNVIEKSDSDKEE